MISTSQKTPLYKAAQALNARMTEFAGWVMPVQFSGIKQEHLAVRRQAGLFDISHMGKFCLRGKEVIGTLDKLVPSDLSRLEVGRAQYTVLLNSEGGIIDDFIVYRRPNEGSLQVVIAIVNAATTPKDRDWLTQNLSGLEICLEDMSKDYVLLALQGPEAIAKLQAFTNTDLSKVRRYGHLETKLGDHWAFLARTGYTGEDGFEIMVSAEIGPIVWQTLLEAGACPCGLGARDTLRLEAAMALYGQDITEDTSPLEAGLGWLVHLDRKQEFMGRKKLEYQRQHGLRRKLVGLRMQGRNIARHGYRVLDGETPVGIVTSGTLAPFLGYPIALAYVPPRLATIGQLASVEIRGNAYPAEVVKRPFYKAA